MNERVETIKARLNKAFSPSILQVIDDSADHIGHAGAAGGAGHYTVIIQAEAFAGQLPVKKHQMVYAVLNDMIGPEIHALRIQASA